MIQIIIFLVLVFAISLVAKRLRGTIITGPMVFTFGGIWTYFLTPIMAQYLPMSTSLKVESPVILQVGEVTLAIILFGGATKISLRHAIAARGLPARLLLVGMPLTILLGTLVASWMFGNIMPFWEGAILATILAPTDASLGEVVVDSELVPKRIREALSVESGLNDGLSMPFFVLFLAMAGYEMHGKSSSWVAFTLMQIGFGILVGFAVGWVGGRLMKGADRKGWIFEGVHIVAMLVLAILAWGVAGAVGGNGFIAAFVAGSTLRGVYNDAINYAEDFEQSWGNLLVYFIFFFFGILAAPWLSKISPLIWLYAILSLTLVRMLPVAISLIGSKLHIGTVLFMGWFGPRGLASVVLGLIYLEKLTRFKVNHTIILTVIATVILSILAHGISAAPLSKRYARYLSKFAVDSPEFT